MRTIVKMRPPIFVFLALVISQAVAFGLYGAYERVMYWNAYQLDAESPERKVAKACAKNPGVQGAKLGNLVNGRCNFRQFLYYISATDKEKANIKRLDANLGNEKNINIIANELYDKGVVGQYTTETLYEGVKRNDVPALFKAMGYLIGQDKNKETEQWKFALQARARVEEGRTATRNRNVGNLLRWEYDKSNQKFDPHITDEVPRDPKLVTEGDLPETMSKSAGKGSARGWKTIDLYEAKKAIEKKHKIQKLDIQSWIKKSDDLEVEPRQEGEDEKAYEERKKEEEKRGHKANINAIRAARPNMLKCVRG